MTNLGYGEEDGDLAQAHRDFTEVLELEPPHGFLMAQEKQTAIARLKPLDVDRKYLIVSGGEAFGVATLEKPAQIKLKEFDGEDWQEQHRVTPRERRQWWGDEETFYIHRLKEWQPYEGVKLFEDGKVIDEPRLTSAQWQLVSAAKELPKVITLLDEAVSITDKSEFIINRAAQCDDLKKVLEATYQIDVKSADGFDEYIPIYSLALVRNPRMRVSKKNLAPEGASENQEAIKQEDDDMPYEMRRRGDEFCVVKINPDETEETVNCHDSEEDAAAQLAALRINVEAEEDEMAKDDDKQVEIITPEKDRGIEKKAGDTFLTRLKLAAKNIIDIITLAEKETTETEDNKLFMNEVGIGQKIVNGELWHFAYSTNAFEDREGEIFSTKSLENYVASNEANEDKGYFNLWHINAEDGNFNTDFARKEWQGVMGRFLVEAGPYLKDEKGKAAKKFFGKYTGGHPEIAPEGWGCSPEFRYLPEERATGTYENIWITRTSTLPKFAAANVWTETRQLKHRGNKMALSEQQKKAAIEIFGDDFVTQMINEAQQKTTDLEIAGVAHKGKEETTPEEKPEQPNINIDMEALAAEVGKQFGANLAPVAEAIETLTAELAALKEWRANVEKERGIKEHTEAPRFIFEWKRSSEDGKTVVTDDDELKKSKPAETRAAAKGGDAWTALFK